MIVPGNRLLLLVGAVVVPLAAAAGLAEEAALPATAAIALLFCAVIADALAAGRVFRGISLEFPQVIRLGRGREALFSFEVKNERGKARHLRVGLAFPEEIRAEHETLLVDLPRGRQLTRFTWKCTPIRRGVYTFDRCHTATASPLGFWSVRRALPIACEMRVYPDLHGERKRLAALFLNRGGLGIHARRQVGQGRDFEKLREYLPGDSLDQIHWKVTAKRAQLVSKVYQIERTQEVYVLIDASRLSGRPAGPDADDSDRGETILERFITAGLVMGAAARRQGDLFGLAVFGDRVQSFIRAHSGRGHYNACREALAATSPSGASPDFRELFSFIGLRLRKRALLVILTNLDDPAVADSFTEGVQLIGRKHLVMTGILRPEGVSPLFSADSVQRPDDIYQALGGHLLWSQIQETGKNLERHGIRFSLLDSSTLCTSLVSQYMEIKGRQML